MIVPFKTRSHSFPGVADARLEKTSSSADALQRF